MDRFPSRREDHPALPSARSRHLAPGATCRSGLSQVTEGLVGDSSDGLRLVDSQGLSPLRVSTEAFIAFHWEMGELLAAADNLQRGNGFESKPDQAANSSLAAAPEGLGAATLELIDLTVCQGLGS